jgi:hypothetical protein
MVVNVNTQVRTIAVHIDCFVTGSLPTIFEVLSTTSEYLTKRGFSEVGISTDDCTEDLS